MARRSVRLTHAIGGALDDAPGSVRAALAAGESAFLSVVFVVLPVFLVWLARPSSTVGGWHAVQLGLAGWGLGHGGPLTVRIGSLSLVPLLFTALAVGTASWSASRLAAGLARTPPARLAWAWGLRRDVAVEGGVFVGTYTAIGLLAALLARNADVAPAPFRTVVAVFVVALVGYVVGLKTEFRADLRQVAPEANPTDRLPPWARAGWAAGTRTVGWLLLAGLLLVVLVVVVRFDRIAGLYDVLSPGLLGGVVLTGVQVLYLPNLAVWGVSWMAGPGFGIGADSSITLTTAEPGLMPLIPLLGALPEPGPLPAVTRIALLVPVLAGVYLERRAGRGVGSDPLDRALAAAAGALVAGVLTALLAAMAGGSLGSARLSAVGAPAVLLGAMLGGELVLGAALSLGVRWLRGSLLGHPEATAAGPAGAGPDAPGRSGRAGTRPSGQGHGHGHGHGIGRVLRPGRTRPEHPSKRH